MAWQAPRYFISNLFLSFVVHESGTLISTEINGSVWPQLSPQVFQASQMVLVMKNPPANAGCAGEVSLITWSGRTPRGGNSNPLQCSCLGNSMDRGAWRATVHEVAESRARLSTHAQGWLSPPGKNGIDFLLWKKIDNKNFRKALQCWLYFFLPHAFTMLFSLARHFVTDY